MADTLNNATFNLDTRQGRVDGNTAINHSGIVKHFYHAGFTIQLDFCHAHHKRRRGNGRRVHSGSLGSLAVAALALNSNLLQGNLLACAFLQYAPAFKPQLLGLAFENVGGNRAQLFL